MQSRLFTLHSDTFSSSPSRFTSSSTSFCDLVRSHGRQSALKTKSKFGAGIRRIRSLCPSKIVTRFRRVCLTGHIRKIHPPKPSTAHQEYRMLKNFQCIHVCIMRVWYANQQERQGGARSAVLMCQQQRTRSDASGRAFSKWDLADLALKLLEQQLALSSGSYLHRICCNSGQNRLANLICRNNSKSLISCCSSATSPQMQGSYTSSMKNII